jgi:hypothetical protein
MTSNTLNNLATHLVERKNPWTWAKVWGKPKTDKKHLKTRLHRHFKPFDTPQVARKTAKVHLSTSIQANIASQTITKAKAKIGPKNSLDFQNDPGKSVASWPCYKAARHQDRQFYTKEAEEKTDCESLRSASIELAFQ